MATMQDVAARAHVSVATVSRVLNNSPRVSERTRRVVEQAIQELGFVPNAAARNLRTNQNRIVAVLIPNITNLFYASLFSGINRRAMEAGYSLCLYYTAGNDPRAVLEQVIEERRADGVILLSISAPDLWVDEYSREFPIVQCSEYARGCKTVHVSVDNYRGARNAVEYLISRGRKKIGVLGTVNQFISTEERQKGYRDAMAAHHLPVEEKWLVNGDEQYSYRSGLAASRKLLEQEERPDAVFCFGDEFALSVIVTATEMGIRVPEDLSVIGFDDMNYTTMLHPYITTVKQPCLEIGETAFEQLILLMNHRPATQTAITLRHTLMIRESTD